MAEIIDGNVVETTTKTTNLSEYITRKKMELNRVTKQAEMLSKQFEIVTQKQQEIITELESIITQTGE